MVRCKPVCQLVKVFLPARIDDINIKRGSRRTMGDRRQTTNQNEFNVGIQERFENTLELSLVHWVLLRLASPARCNWKIPLIA